MPTYLAEITAASQKYSVPPALIEAVIQVESGGNPDAVSSKGAMGLMQLMPGTAADLKVPGDEVFAPAVNIDAGTRYLAEQLQATQGDIPQALSRYNTGPNSGARNTDYEQKVLARMARIEADREEQRRQAAQAIAHEEQRRAALAMLQEEERRRRQPPSLALPTTPAPRPSPYDPASPVSFDFLTEKVLPNALLYGSSALAGALTSGASIPVQAAAQLATTGAQQYAGLVPKGLMPYVDTLLGEMAGVPINAGIRGGAQALASRMKAGQLLEVNEQLARLGERVEEATEIGRMTQGDIAEALAKNTTLLQRRMATMAPQLEREAAAITALKSQVEGVNRAGRLQSLTLQERAAQVSKQAKLARAGIALAETQNATTAQRWIAELPVPDVATRQALYAQVDEVAGAQLPREVIEAMDQARARLAKDARDVEVIAPELVNRQVARLGEARQAASAVPEVGTPTIGTLGAQRTAIGALKVPLKDQADAGLELQDFLRKPDATSGQWGVKLGDNDLFTELHALLGRKEAGSARLLNSERGYSPQAMAERAYQAGFLDNDDVGTLLRALDESLAGRPVYSKNADLPEIGFAEIDPGASLGGEATFAQAQRALRGYGERVAEAKRQRINGVEGAADMHRVWSTLYGTLQEALKKAESSDALTAEARKRLQVANAAHSVYATAEELRDLMLNRITRDRAGTGESLHLGRLLDDLDDKSQGPLVAKLKDMKLYDGLQEMLTEARRAVGNPSARLKAAQELATELQQMRPVQALAKEAELTRLQTLIKQHEEQLTILEKAQERSQAIRGSRAERLEAMKAKAQEALAERLGQLRGAEARLKAERPTRSTWDYVPSSGIGAGVGMGIGGYETALYGVAIADGLEAVSHMLMTKDGQRVLGKFMRATAGDLPGPMAHALISVARTMFPFTGIPRQVESGLTVLFPPTPQQEPPR